MGDLAKIKNITVYYINGLKSKNRKYNGKMHMKMAIIDNKLIYFGSANWSKSAFSVNYEILYNTNNLAVIKKGLDYFDFIKQKATLY
jgi:phosphatidylserine/phosphatidylglycerophosphate/cardiolipin synthase-like enzyme